MSCLAAAAAPCLASLFRDVDLEKLFPFVGGCSTPFSSGLKKSSGCGKSWNQSANPVSTSGVDWLPMCEVHVAGDHLQRGVESELGQQVVVVLADPLRSGSSSVHTVMSLSAGFASAISVSPWPCRVRGRA